MTDITFAIGEAAAMLGLSPHTIRAWERRHLLARPMRTPSGQRRYTAEDIELLRQIKYERHVHGHSMRVATMTAQGLLVPDASEASSVEADVPEGWDRSAEPLRLVPDLVSEVVIVLDTSGQIQHANIAFVRFCDVLLSQLEGLPFADFVDPFDRAKAVQAYHEPLRVRRGWELGLRTKHRRALFSFDCWPAPTSDGPLLLLIGRHIEPAPAADETTALAPVGVEAHEPGAPRAVGAALEEVADATRTIELLRPWLDATPWGVALIRADAALTVAAVNEAFRRLVPDRLPAEGRPWQDLEVDDEAGRLGDAAHEVVAGARRISLSGFRPQAAEGRPAPASWDLELSPVTRVGGAVTHLLLSVRDVTAEVAAASALEALVDSAPELRQAPDARQALAVTARRARQLLPNAGVLVVTASGREHGAVRVVAADGVWARREQSAERDLRLALVRDVVRTGVSIEVERSGAGGSTETGTDTETVRAVPLLATPVPSGPATVLGALAFARLDAGSFSALERLLIDEFAGRVGMALGWWWPAPGRP